MNQIISNQSTGGYFHHHEMNNEEPSMASNTGDPVPKQLDFITKPLNIVEHFSTKMQSR